MIDKIFGGVYIIMSIFLVLATIPTKSLALWIIPPICLMSLGLYKIFKNNN